MRISKNIIVTFICFVIALGAIVGGYQMWAKRDGFFGKVVDEQGNPVAGALVDFSGPTYRLFQIRLNGREDADSNKVDKVQTSSDGTFGVSENFKIITIDRITIGTKQWDRKHDLSTFYMDQQLAKEARHPFYQSKKDSPQIFHMRE